MLYSVPFLILFHSSFVFFSFKSTSFTFHTSFIYSTPSCVLIFSFFNFYNLVFSTSRFLALISSNLNWILIRSDVLCWTCRYSSDSLLKPWNLRKCNQPHCILLSVSIFTTISQYECSHLECIMKNVYLSFSTILNFSFEITESLSDCVVRIWL